ncbi:MAG TPA: hypothetical protein VNA25_25435 [Phycisphaerae bacterium]|nr:hypothetical protein [Phycisphaerae bacterium]
MPGSPEGVSPVAALPLAREEAAWLRRPSLAYHGAFDLLGAEAARAGGPTAVLASSAFYAREVVRRLDGEVLLHFPRDPGLGESEIQTALGPEVDWARLRVASSMMDTAMAEAQTVVWAEPERGTWQAILANLRDSGPCTVLILGTTWLRRLLPEWRAVDRLPAAAPLASIRRIATALPRLGYAVSVIYGFHGPRSLVWGPLSRIPAALDRDDLVDRLFAATRQDYVVVGWQAHSAVVSLIIALRVRG